MSTADLLKQLNVLHNDCTEKKTGAREEMLVAAYALIASIQTPSEMISRAQWAEVREPSKSK
jgi:hypothetical protein